MFPVIVVGMHRSGTTLLARLLQQMGIDMGAGDSSTCESVAMRKLNISLLRRARATWFDPAPMRSLLADPQACRREVDWLRSCVAALRIGEELRIADWGLRIEEENGVDSESCSGNPQSAIGNPQFPWGWKDPRTTLTLPLWNEVFPEARVVAVVRNGVDVADSLTRRERQQFQSPLLNVMRQLAHAVYPWHWPEFKATPFDGLDDAFRLWVEYQEFWDTAVDAIPSRRRLTMRYEDLLAEPWAVLQNVAEFLELPIGRWAVAEIAPTVNEQRRFAFRSDERLALFYESCREHPAMLRYGYHASGQVDESARKSQPRRGAA